MQAMKYQNIWWTAGGPGMWSWNRCREAGFLILKLY